MAASSWRARTEDARRSLYDASFVTRLLQAAPQDERAPLTLGSFVPRHVTKGEAEVWSRRLATRRIRGHMDQAEKAEEDAMDEHENFPKGSLMKGRRGVVMGVANKNSIAWAISQQLAAQGAEIELT